MVLSLGLRRRGWPGAGDCSARSMLAPLIGFRSARLLPWLYRPVPAGAAASASFEEQLPDAIDLMARAMRAGHPLAAGFKMVADEAPEPIAREFRRIFEEQRFGLPFDDSLLALGERVPLVRHPDPDHGDPDPSPGRRQPGRGARQPRRPGPGALQAPPPAPGHHGPGPAVGLRARRAADRRGRRDLLTINPEYMMPIFEHELGRIMLVGSPSRCRSWASSGSARSSTSSSEWTACSIIIAVLAGIDRRILVVFFGSQLDRLPARPRSSAGSRTCPGAQGIGRVRAPGSGSRSEQLTCCCRRSATGSRKRRRHETTVRTWLIRAGYLPRPTALAALLGRAGSTALACWPASPRCSSARCSA